MVRRENFVHAKSDGGSPRAVTVDRRFYHVRVVHLLLFDVEGTSDGFVGWNTQQDDFLAGHALLHVHCIAVLELYLPVFVLTIGWNHVPE